MSSPPFFISFFYFYIFFIFLYLFYFYIFLFVFYIFMVFLWVIFYYFHFHLQWNRDHLIKLSGPFSADNLLPFRRSDASLYVILLIFIMYSVKSSGQIIYSIVLNILSNFLIFIGTGNLPP